MLAILLIFLSLIFGGVAYQLHDILIGALAAALFAVAVWLLTRGPRRPSFS